MRILHIIIGLDVRGVGAMLKRLIEPDPGIIPETVVVSLSLLGVIGESLRARAVCVHTLEMRSAFGISLLLWRLVRLSRPNRPNIIGPPVRFVSKPATSPQVADNVPKIVVSKPVYEPNSCLAPQFQAIWPIPGRIETRTLWGRKPCQKWRFFDVPGFDTNLTGGPRGGAKEPSCLN